MSDPRDGTPVEGPETKWLRFGVTVAIGQALFVLLVVGLLRIDRTLGLVVAVALSVAGGIGIMVFVRYVS